MTLEQVKASIRNALARVRIWSGVPEARLKRLREFSIEILAPVVSYVNRDLLRPQEACYLFLAMAMFMVEAYREELLQEEDLIRVFGPDAVAKIREVSARYENFEEEE